MGDRETKTEIKGWNEMGSKRKCTQLEYDPKEVSVVLPEQDKCC